MNIIEKPELNDQEKLKAYEIWNQVYPKQVCWSSLDDFENYLQKNTEARHLLATTGSILLGWLTIFNRADDRWFAIIINPTHQRKGIGSRLIQEMKVREDCVNGWIVLNDIYQKLDGTTYPSPKNFYKKQGFVLTDEAFKTEILTSHKIFWSNTSTEPTE